MTDTDALASVRAELVLANHVLAGQGVVDGWGHVSVRHPDATGRFLRSRSLAPALVQEGDLLELSVETGEPVDGGRGYLERHIHAGVYRARADVQAVVHSHTPDVIPFGATDTRLRPLLHVSAFLGEGVRRFEIRDVAGASSSMLIETPELGDALARVLGAAPVVLMRGHGMTVAGSSLRQAVYRAVYTQANASAQLQAQTLGLVAFLSDGEAAAAGRTVDAGVDRVWDLWAHEHGEG